MRAAGGWGAPAYPGAAAGQRQCLVRPPAPLARGERPKEQHESHPAESGANRMQHTPATEQRLRIRRVRIAIWRDQLVVDRHDAHKSEGNHRKEEQRAQQPHDTRTPPPRAEACERADCSKYNLKSGCSAIHGGEEPTCERRPHFKGGWVLNQCDVERGPEEYATAEHGDELDQSFLFRRPNGPGIELPAARDLTTPDGRPPARVAYRCGRPAAGEPRDAS